MKKSFNYKQPFKQGPKMLSAQRVKRRRTMRNDPLIS